MKKGLRDNTLILFHSDNGGTKNAMFAGVNSPDQMILAGLEGEDYRTMDSDQVARISERCSLYR